MAFNGGPGFTTYPGMYYPMYRFNLGGGSGESAWDAYFLVCNYSGSPVSNEDLLGAIKDAVSGLPDVESVQVVRYEQTTADVTSTL